MGLSAGNELGIQQFVTGWGSAVSHRANKSFWVKEQKFLFFQSPLLEQSLICVIQVAGLVRKLAQWCHYAA